MEKNNNGILMWFETKKEKRRRRISLIIGIALALLTLVAFIVTPIISYWDQCEESNSVKELEFNGIVTKKTLNKENKYQQKIRIKQTEEIITLNLSNEILKLKESGNSITWEKLSIHDSIKKEKGTFRIKYKKRGKDSWKTLKMAFPDCEKLEETVTNSKYSK